MAKGIETHIPRGIEVTEKKLDHDIEFFGFSAVVRRRRQSGS